MPERERAMAEPAVMVVLAEAPRPTHPEAEALCRRTRAWERLDFTMPALEARARLRVGANRP